MFRLAQSCGAMSLAFAVCVATAATPAAESPNVTASPATIMPLQAFTVVQSVQWKGISAGISTLTLTRTAVDRWTYSSRSEARGIARLLVPGDITQTSQFAIVDGKVQPRHFRANAGSRDDSKDVSFDFDWPHNRVTGVAERQPVSLELRPGVQDDLSAQIATMLELERGTHLPPSFSVVDKDEIKEYRYSFDGTARLRTAVGTVDTLVVSSQRKGSSRSLRTWFAPSLGYVPVKAERLHDGKLEFSMSIRSLKR